MLTMFRRRAERVDVDRDAERLIGDFGEAAFTAAGEMSWREDAGLMASRGPGHWHRVQEEVARRQARATASVPSIRGHLDRPLKEQLAGLQ